MEDAEAAAAPAAAPSRCRVLIVDDDPFAGMVLEELVRSVIYGDEDEVIICECIEEACEQAGEQDSPAFDVVRAGTTKKNGPKFALTDSTCAPQMLLDWELEDDVTGLDVARKLRPHQAAARIIIVSGNEHSDLAASVSEELDSLGVSPDDWWGKPATIDHVTRLANELSATRAAAAAASQAEP